MISDIWRLHREWGVYLKRVRGGWRLGEAPKYCRIKLRLGEVIIIEEGCAGKTPVL